MHPPSLEKSLPTPHPAHLPTPFVCFVTRFVSSIVHKDICGVVGGKVALHVRPVCITSAQRALSNCAIRIDVEGLCVLARLDFINPTQSFAQHPNNQHIQCTVTPSYIHVHNMRSGDYWLQIANVPKFSHSQSLYTSTHKVFGFNGFRYDAHARACGWFYTATYAHTPRPKNVGIHGFVLCVRRECVHMSLSFPFWYIRT